jgi:TPR repeat protein
MLRVSLVTAAAVLGVSAVATESPKGQSPPPPEALVAMAGTLVDTNWARAQALYGQADACYYTGLASLLGADGPKDVPRAARLLQRACDLGQADACVELASVYEAREPARAEALFAKAARLTAIGCEAGEMRRCGGLAWLYTRGRGVPHDLAEAARLLQKGCDGGELILCRRLGNVYVRGDGVSRDSARATELFQRACSGGLREACQDIKRQRWAAISPVRSY